MVLYRAFCLLSPPFLPLFAPLCSPSNIGRSMLASCTREFCNARRAQSVVIYFAIAINKSRCSARSRDLIALPFLSLCLFQVTSRLTTSVIGRSCHDHLLSLSDFFYPLPLPALLSVLTVNISYTLANIERYFLSRYTR